ncbi:MAG: histidine-type phosphatase, partial [Rhodococcus sp. (in: high G+C Gram-positive bacteria)]
MRSSRFGVLAAAGAVGLVLVTSSVQSIATASPFGSLDAGSSSGSTETPTVSNGGFTSKTPY